MGLAPLTIPAVGRPGFTIEPGTMEFGIGHHGETGIRTEPYDTAEHAADLVVNAILEDFAFGGQRRLAVMVSGLGSTPAMEPYIIFNTVAARLEERGHTVERAYVGDFVTSLDMNGFSVSVLDLDDDISELLAAPGTAYGIPSY